MRIATVIRILISVMIFSLTIAVSEAQSFKRPPAPRQGRKALRRSPSKKRQAKIVEPRSVAKAKKKQEADERKRQRDYKKYVKENRQRSLEIQTPKVRERMKQNIKNANNSYRFKKRNLIVNSRKFGKKYKR